jgi:hypothetical protein
MPMQKTHDLVAVIKREGRDQPNYIRCGALFRGEGGKLSIKVDSVPACDWNGWLSVMEPRDDKPQAARPAKAQRPDPDDDLSSVPF